MTISTTTRKAGPFTGNGVVTLFPFVFKVFSKADLKVIRTNTAGIETTLVLDSNYSVSLNADQNSTPGGTVTYSTLAVGEKLTIVGNQLVVQPTDITNGSGFYPEVIEDALDRNVISMQQIYEAVARTIRFPSSDPFLPAELPTALNRAGRALVFQGNGDVGLSASAYDDQAGAAAISAAQAAASATAAQGSAGNANTSAINAQASAISASVDAAAAAATYDNFDDRYLGPKATNPTVDNDGGALLNGAMFFNTTLGIMMVYSTAVGAWQSAGATGIRQVYNFAAGVDFTAGVTTSLNLPANPLAEENLMIFFNATYQYHTTYSLSGTVVTFSAPIPGGTTTVEIVATSNSSYGPQGIQGIAGNTVLSGTGAPGAGLGVNGDFYINRTNWDLYGPKTAGAWSLATSLIGPNGPGTGNVLGPASSLTDEIALFNGTTGQLLKRATFSGILKGASGVLSAAVAGTDYAPATSGNAILKGNGAGGTTSAVAATDYAAVGAVGATGITMSTARLLGRTTASTGAIEEISIGTGLALTAGVLSWNASVGDHEVSVGTGNGYGSVANKIRRFTTVISNIGTAITYSDSATQGGTFTINESGLYSLFYFDGTGDALITYGFSRNAVALSTGIATPPNAINLGFMQTTLGFGAAPITRIVRLNAGDIIRAHTNGEIGPSTNAISTFFAIRKVNT